MRDALKRLINIVVNTWMLRKMNKDVDLMLSGIGVQSGVAINLLCWAGVTMGSDLRKTRRILSVAKRIEQRYRLAHGLPNMGV